MEDTRTAVVVCDHCGSRVPHNNWALHQARCAAAATAGHGFGGGGSTSGTSRPNRSQEQQQQQQRRRQQHPQQQQQQQQGYQGGASRMMDHGGCCTWVLLGCLVGVLLGVLLPLGVIGILWPMTRGASFKWLQQMSVHDSGLAFWCLLMFAMHCAIRQQFYFLRWGTSANFPANNDQDYQDGTLLHVLDWTHPMDDFWSPYPVPPTPNGNRLEYTFTEQLTLPRLDQMRDHFNRVEAAVTQWQWTKEPVQRGLCIMVHTYMYTVCRVQRWNAYIDIDEDNLHHDSSSSGSRKQQLPSRRLAGRLQCWDDPSLLHSQPDFAQVWHYEFSLLGFGIHALAGALCLLEVTTTTSTPQPMLVVVGDSNSFPNILVHDLAFEEMYPGAWDIYFDDDETAVSVVQKMRDYAFHILQNNLHHDLPSSSSSSSSETTRDGDNHHHNIIVEEAQHAQHVHGLPDTDRETDEL